MARPGLDSPFDESQMKVGRRLAMKVLNASRFVLGMGATDLNPAAVSDPVDCALLGRLDDVVRKATDAFEAYDYTTALEVDREVLLGVLRRLPRAGQGAGVRRRPAGPGTASARATLAIALDVQLRLLAPFLPYVTEEVWSWWREGSIHRASVAGQRRPRLGRRGGDPSLIDAVAAALIGIRGAKSQAKVSMKAPLARVEITGPATQVARCELAADDLRSSGKITGDLVFTVVADADADQRRRGAGRDRLRPEPAQWRAAPLPRALVRAAPTLRSSAAVAAAPWSSPRCRGSAVVSLRPLVALVVAALVAVALVVVATAVALLDRGRGPVPVALVAAVVPTPVAVARRGPSSSGPSSRSPSSVVRAVVRRGPRRRRSSVVVVGRSPSRSRSPWSRSPSPVAAVVAIAVGPSPWPCPWPSAVRRPGRRRRTVRRGAVAVAVVVGAGRRRRRRITVGHGRHRRRVTVGRCRPRRRRRRSRSAAAVGVRVAVRRRLPCARPAVARGPSGRLPGVSRPRGLGAATAGVPPTAGVADLAPDADRRRRCPAAVAARAAAAARRRDRRPRPGPRVEARRGRRRSGRRAGDRRRLASTVGASGTAGSGLLHGDRSTCSDALARGHRPRRRRASTVGPRARQRSGRCPAEHPGDHQMRTPSATRT